MTILLKNPKTIQQEIFKEMGLPDNTDLSKLTKKQIDIFVKKFIITDENPISIKSELPSPLRSIYERKYEVWDNARYISSIKCCQYCGKVMAYDNIPTLKYCNRECRLSAYYERRNNVKGIQKNIVIHETCLVCGKSLTGKRAGTKTCSMSCRKQLSIKNNTRKKIISSP